MAQVIEKVARAIINPLLLDLQVSVDKRMFGHAQSLVDSQLPDTDVLASTVRTKVERVLPLHPPSSPYGTQSGYCLEDSLKELTQKPDRASVARPSKVWPTGVGGTNCIEEESVVEKKTIYLPIHRGSGGDFRYAGDERSRTGENRRGKRYCQKKKADTKYRGGKSKPKK